MMRLRVELVLLFVRGLIIIH